MKSVNNQNVFLVEAYEEMINEFDASFFKEKTFVVTGASGFIASSIVRFLLFVKNTVECQIVLLSHDYEGAFNKYEDVINTGRVELREWNIYDFPPISERVDYVFHTSSPAVTKWINLHPADTLSVNAIGTRQLLEMCRKNKCQGFLYFSSESAQGDMCYSADVVGEDDIYNLDYLDTKKSYAEGKRFGEALCKAYYVQYGIHAKIARLSHTYGPGISLSDGRIFSDFVSYIIEGRDIVIKGDGSDVRTYMYITDAIRGLLYVLFFGDDGLPYKVSNPKETMSVRELADRLCIEAFPEKKLRVVCTNNEAKKKKTPIISIERLRNVGFEPRVGVVEGFRKTVESFIHEDKSPKAKN